MSIPMNGLLSAKPYSPNMEIDTDYKKRKRGAESLC